MITSSPSRNKLKNLHDLQATASTSSTTPSATAAATTATASARRRSPEERKAAPLKQGGIRVGMAWGTGEQWKNPSCLGYVGDSNLW